MQSKQKTRWWLDAGLFSGLILACFLDLTGLELHQWIGLLAGLGALYHLVTHLDWVQAVSRRFFGKTSAISRVYLALDAALLAGFATMVGTGLVISSWFNLELSSYAVWRSAHILATIASVATAFIKVILHRGWIILTARKIFSPAAPAAPGLPAQAGAINRRAFIGTLGTVSLASFLALSESFKSLADGAQDSGVTLTEAINTPSTTTSTTSSAKTANIASSSSSSCVLRCNKRCSFPGHCRKYIDSSGNGRCDLGECA